jgi:protein-disulfide isomerase
MLLLAVFLAACAALAQQPAPGVVAIVNGVEIRESDLNLHAQLASLAKQEYDIKMRAVQTAIGRKVIEQAAKEKGLTVEQFIVLEVDAKIAEPTDAELQGFYLARRDQYREPFERVRDQVRQAVRDARIQQARQALADRLLTSAAIKILLRPPRTSVDVGAAPRRGSPQAPVTIVEFSDYQCPFCKRAQPTLRLLAAKYGDRVAFVFKDYPLDELHPEARVASEAAHCAAEQGKYWEYHDALFALSPALGRDKLLEAARQLGLNETMFSACVSTRRYTARVEQDFQQGRQLGVDGTPAFFINGVSLTGAVPLAEFEKIIDAELARK